MVSLNESWVALSATCVDRRVVGWGVRWGLFLFLVMGCAEVLSSLGRSSAAIARGSEAGTCAFPSAVALRGGGSLCSGVLIHPQVVAYAGHCGDGFTTVQFGEDSPYERTVSTSTCAVHPEFELRPTRSPNWDYAYCVLDEAVTDVPIVPPIAGCELEEVVVGTPSFVVGFGDTEASGLSFGRKRWFPATLARAFGAERPGGQHLSSSVFGSPDETPEACGGDSGGPTYIRLSDGTFRVLGVHSTASVGCGSGSGVNDSLLHVALPWIESDSGFDVTPCHDAPFASCTVPMSVCETGATWVGGASCNSVPTDIETGSGAWPCAPPTADPVEITCGDEPTDAGSVDASEPIDASAIDGSTPTDGGTDASRDAAVGPDSASPSDGSSRADADETGGGGGCSSAGSPRGALGLALLLLCRRRSGGYSLACSRR